MKRRLLPFFAISTSALLLLNASGAWACQNGSTTITNLQDGSLGVIYEVSGMNQSGQLTGFFIDRPNGLPQHAMAYTNGVRGDLGTLGGPTSEGHSINVAGQIVGVSDLTGGTQSHAFITSAAGLQDLSTLGGNSSTATAINDNGVIIGDSDLQGGGTSAFILTNGVGVMTSIGSLGSNYSSAFGLNNNNLVVGQAGVASGGTNAFSYFNGVLSNLGTLGADYSAAFAVNDAGEIVGESAINSTDTHGFVYMNGTMTDVGTLGGTFSTAYLVSPTGQAVGVASLVGEAEIHGFLYANGTMTDLGTLGGAFSLPNAINTKGQIVGDSVDELGNGLAFIWENGTLTDLNALLPANSGWVLMQAVFINDAGRIAGVGEYKGVSQWFIMDLVGPNNNNPPVAVAGPDQTVSCSDQAKLDGSGSHDADSDPLTYEWSVNGSVLGTNVTLNVALPIGDTVVKLKVSDPCGESTSDNLTVTVVDTNAPTGTCPASVTVSADTTCQAAVPDFVPQVSGTDNCTTASSLVITQDLAPGALVGLGPHTITITVKDTSGNASSCQVLFTVVDTTPPTITGMPAPFTVLVGSDCQAQMPNMLGNVTATDSCTFANLLVKSQNPAAGTPLGVGVYPLTVTVKDAAGNPATATVNFTVADTTPPAIHGGVGRTVSSDATCQGTVPNMFDGFLSISDNCTPANQLVTTQSPAAGIRLSTGSYPVTTTVTDLSGNTSTFVVLLIISDNTAPVIQTLSVSPNVLSPPNHQLVPVTVSAVVTDTCDAAPVVKIVSISTNDGTSPGDITITGNLTALLAANKTASGGTRVYTITVQATDASTNRSTAQVTVTVPKSNGSSGS